MKSMNSLNNQMLFFAFSGICYGLLLHHFGEQHYLYQPSITVCKFIGSLFIDLLKMLLIPVIFLSIVVGMGGLAGHDSAGKVWRLTLTYFFMTTVFAAVLGLSAVTLFEPGKGLSLSIFHDVMEQSPPKTPVSIELFFSNFMHGIFINPFTAMANGDILATLIFALFFGSALAAKKRQARTLFKSLRQSLEVIMQILGWIMQIAPLGVFALLTRLIATQQPDFYVTLAKFIFVIIACIAVHALLVLPLLSYLMTGLKPWRFLYRSRLALLTAFATCSSNATVPVTLRVIHEELGVSARITDFVTPLGASLNKDGTAMYEAGAAVFIANLAGMDLSLSQQIIICFMATLSSLGAPGIPSTGMVTMMMVLQAVGLPVEAVAILLPIDRFIDAFRTLINVEGDMVAALVVERISSNFKKS